MIKEGVRRESARREKMIKRTTCRGTLIKDREIKTVHGENNEKLISTKIRSLNSFVQENVNRILRKRTRKTVK